MPESMPMLVAVAVRVTGVRVGAGMAALAGTDTSAKRSAVRSEIIKAFIRHIVTRARQHRARFEAGSVL